SDELPGPDPEAGLWLAGDGVERLAVAPGRGRPGGDAHAVKLGEDGDQRGRLADVLGEAEKRDAPRSGCAEPRGQRPGGAHRPGPASDANAADSEGWRRSNASAVSSCPGTKPLPIHKRVGLARPSAPSAAAENDVAIPK